MKQSSCFLLATCFFSAVSLSLSLSPLSVINGTVGWQVRAVSAAMWNAIFHFLKCRQTHKTHYYRYTQYIYAHTVSYLFSQTLDFIVQSWTIKVVCWVVFSKRHATDNNGELGTYGKAMAALCINLEDASPTSASAVIPLSQPHFLFFFSLPVALLYLFQIVVGKNYILLLCTMQLLQVPSYQWDISSTVGQSINLISRCVLYR